MKLKERNPDSKLPISKPDRIGRRMYRAAVVSTMMAMCSIHAFAAGETVWTKAQQIMNDVYGQIVTIKHHRRRDDGQCRPAADELLQKRAHGG